jgi:hypothetical protein
VQKLSESRVDLCRAWVFVIVVTVGCAVLQRRSLGVAGLSAGTAVVCGLAASPVAAFCSGSVPRGGSRACGGCNTGASLN